MKRRMTASYTVEAALLVSMMLFLVLLVVYTGFYFHDRLSLSFVLRETIRWSMTQEEQGFSVSGTAIETEAVKRQGFLFCINHVSYTGNVEGGTISLSYYAQTRIPFSSLRYLLMNHSSGRISYYLEEEIWKPENSLRKARLIREALE